jgi:membrane-bound lytic murein transglycosylase B
LLALAITCSVIRLAPAGEKPPDFEKWLVDLRSEALARGISGKILDAALTGVEPIPRIIELDRNQPEFKLTLEEYVKRVVSSKRVAMGRRKLAENRELLEQMRRRYNVQPRFLVAFWGIESNFGSVTGGFPVVDALATLAHDTRRSAFFRSELLDALHILDAGHIATKQMRGSWAGAMGQLQFMPSTFRRHGVDADGDARIDIWNSRPDVFASAANYLAQSGWKGDQIWGREVRLPEGFDRDLIGRDLRKRLSQWQALGVRRASGRDLPRPDLLSSIVQPDGPGGRAFVVYDNYRAILEWNRSDLFAISVGMLADRIVGR